MKFDPGVLYKNLSSNFNFCENGLHDGHILRGVVSGLLYVVCIFLDDLGAIRCDAGGRTVASTVTVLSTLLTAGRA